MQLDGVGDEDWTFTTRWGRPADVPGRSVPLLVARRPSWLSSDREVITADGTWLLRFPGYFGRTVEVWLDGRRAGEVRSRPWRRQPVVVTVRGDLPLVDLVWLSWHGLDMRVRREDRLGGGGGG